MGSKIQEAIAVSQEMERLKEIFREHSVNPDRWINWNRIRVGNSVGLALRKIHSEGITTPIVYEFFDENNDFVASDHYQYCLGSITDLDVTLTECGITKSQEIHMTEEGALRSATDLKKLTSEIARRWYQRHVLKITPERQFSCFD